MLEGTRAVLDAVTQDVGYAIRGLTRAPGLALTIVVAFALGLGVNAALFTVIDRLYFQAPPGVADPGSVRRLLERGRSYDGSQYVSDAFTTRDHDALASVGIGAVEGYKLETQHDLGNGQRTGVVAYATRGFFQLAGVHPYRGRSFTPEENVYGAPVNVAVVSYGYWNRAMGGDAAAIGATIRVDTSAFTVIGIAPPRFDGLDLDAVDVWAPLAALPATNEGPWWTGDFGILELFARLPRGVDARQATSRFTVAMRRLNAERARRDATLGVEAAPLLQARTPTTANAQTDRSIALAIRLAGVGLLVLLIAMSNVASLLLMRALKRRREIAIRIALGVSRGRLMSQMIIESLLLALIGTGVAVSIAVWSSAALRHVLVSNVQWTTTVIDTRFVVFALGLGVLAGCAAGVLPAIVGLRDNMLSALKTGSSESGRPKSGVRVSLLVTQTALCMLMLTAAGMFVQTLRKVRDFDLGFDADRLITVYLGGVPRGLLESTVDRIRALPSVASVGGSSGDLHGAGFIARVILSAGDTVPLARAPFSTNFDTAYAGATGMRVLAGRTFSRSDLTGEPVVVVNQAMASEVWHGRNPVGDCVKSMVPGDQCARVIGVVTNARWYLTRPAHATLYRLPSPPRSPCCTYYQVRTKGDATRETVDAIEQILATVPAVQPNRPATARLVRERLEPQIRPFRVAAGMFLLFGVLALAAASAGIYGLAGYDVAQRTREFGVRIALGATSMSILKLVIGSGVSVVVFGLAAGVVISLAAGRVMASLLFETSPYDPQILVTTAVALSIVALIASLVPAWRAARADPVVALRSD